MLRIWGEPSIGAFVFPNIHGVPMKLENLIASSLAALALATSPVFAGKDPASSKDAGAVTAGPAATTPATEPGSMFDRLDADKDGFVSATEAQQAKGLAEAFPKADTNGDGRLDAGEFSAIQRM